MNDGKAIHKNYSNLNEALSQMQQLILTVGFQQVLIQRANLDQQLVIKYAPATLDDNKVTSVKVLNRKKEEQLAIAPSETLESHDRKKDYLLEEGTVVPFLVELGIMNKDSGKIYSNKYNKFKQMNHFLEIFQDVFQSSIVKDGSSDHPIRIVDFGCGKCD